MIVAAYSVHRSGVCKQLTIKKLKKSAKPTVFLPRPVSGVSVTSTQIMAEHNYASPDIKLLKRR